MTTQMIKKTIDEWLNDVDYSFLNSSEYVPSAFALKFVNFIKLVNGMDKEESATPPMHYKMLDGVGSESKYLVNLCFRGASKTTIMAEYLILYLAVFGELPHMGKVSGMLYVSDSMENGAKNLRKNVEFRYYNSEFLSQWITKATFTDNYLEFESKTGHRLGVKLYGAQTGIRGSKIFSRRPTLAILDDLLKDSDARSPTTVAAIKDTIYRGINHALHTKHRKIIMSGTPFNMDDPMIEAVESGTWDVNVYPVCETFPVDEAEFKPAWGDRFTYAYVKEQYNLAVSVGQGAGFYQELMLRINTSENRMVEDHDIRWYKRDVLLKNKHKFNFYITTDFATSAKQKADYSVISVWAYSSAGYWFWVDGVCKRQKMDATINDLFRLVQEYKPLGVGIETNGQQAGFVSWIQTEMLNRNTWFTLASNEGSNPGVRSHGDKLTRFALVVPMFKVGRISFPEEQKTSTTMGEFMLELRLATTDGFKGKDDCLDTISMLSAMNPIKPYDYGTGTRTQEVNSYADPEDDDIMGTVSTLGSYIV